MNLVAKTVVCLVEMKAVCWAHYWAVQLADKRAYPMAVHWAEYWAAKKVWRKAVCWAAMSVSYYGHRSWH